MSSVQDGGGDDPRAREEEGEGEAQAGIEVVPMELIDEPQARRRSVLGGPFHVINDDGFSGPLG